MQTEYKLFRGVAIFVFLVTGAYWVLAREPVGTTALALTFGMLALIGYYLWFVGRRIDARPEDRTDADIDEGAGEMGFFSPHSWWPLPVAAGGAVVFVGLIFGFWLAAIGLSIAALGVLGFVYEYYRGEFSH